MFDFLAPPVRNTLNPTPVTGLCSRATNCVTP